MSPKGGTGRSKREREKAKREARLQPFRASTEHTLRVGRAKDDRQHEPGRGETAP